jgi:hypothetical protein
MRPGADFLDGVSRPPVLRLGPRFARRAALAGASADRTDWWVRVGLVLVLAGGLALRVWSVAYGLPDLYHPDEPRIVERAIRFHQGDLNPRFFNWPSLAMYVLAGVYGLLFGGASGGVAGAFAQDPALFYLVGRLITVAFGTVTLAVLYLGGRLAYGRTVGLLAAALLAVDLLHVRDSHWITPDVPMTFLVALATLYALRYWRGGRPVDAGAAGLIAGLATSMKYPGGLVFLALLAAHALRRPGESPWRRLVGRHTVVGGALGAVGFALGTPFALLTPVAFARGVLDELREVNTVQFGNEADVPGYLFHLAYSLPQAMGWPLYLLALAGLAWALGRRGPQEAILLAFPVPYLLVIITWSSRFERYVIPLLPCLTLLAAVMVERGAGWLTARMRFGRRGTAVVLAAAAAILIVPGLMRGAQYHRLLARPDTRVLGSEWVERHIPPGARIALEPFSLRLRVAREQRARGPEALGHLPQLPPVAGAPAAPGSEDGYWLERLDVYDLDRLLRDGVQYVVLSGFTYQRHRQACERYPEPCRFYAELEARSRLVFSASPGVDDARLAVGDIYSPLTRIHERRRPGPSIRIYQLPEGERA